MYVENYEGKKRELFFFLLDLVQGLLSLKSKDSRDCNNFSLSRQVRELSVPLKEKKVNITNPFITKLILNTTTLQKKKYSYFFSIYSL